MRAGLALAVLLGTASVGHAESLYVIEQLVLGVMDAPDDAGQRIATVRSGERVELLERLDDEARVRLAGGTEGWVKAAYLSAELPLRVQLAERTRELDNAKTQLSQVERELADVRVAAVAAQPADTPAPAASIAPTDRPLFPARSTSRPVPSWPWVGLACVLALGAGFALGWRVLDRRIRRKYGGLRIY
jgi:hypothetical protein